MQENIPINIQKVKIAVTVPRNSYRYNSIIR